MNKIIADEKDINDEIFWDYFKYKNPSFLAKDLIRAIQAKHEQIVNNVNDGLIDLRNDINRKEISENEHPTKVVKIVEKIVDFNKRQNCKRIEIFNPKPKLQRLPMALAQVKAGNTSEKLLNEISKIIYSLYRVTTKVYNNIMNTIKL